MPGVCKPGRPPSIRSYQAVGTDAISRRAYRDRIALGSRPDLQGIAACNIGTTASSAIPRHGFEPALVAYRTFVAWDRPRDRRMLELLFDLSSTASLVDGGAWNFLGIY